MEDLIRKIEKRIANKHKNKWTYKLKYKFYDYIFDYNGIIMFFIICLFTSLMVGIACYFVSNDIIFLLCLSGIPLGYALLCILMSKLVDSAQQLRDEAN